MYKVACCYYITNNNDIVIICSSHIHYFDYNMNMLYVVYQGQFPTPSNIHSFSCRRKRESTSRGNISLLPIFPINVSFTYAMYFFFLYGPGTVPDTLIYSFFFVPPKKRVNVPREYIPFTHFSYKRVVYICNVLFLSARPERKVPKRKKPPTRTPAPLPAKGLTKRL